MLRTKSEYPNLENFFSRAFASPVPGLLTIDQIIKDDFSTFRGVGDLNEIIEDLNSLIKRDHSEEELAEIMYQLGMWVGIDNNDWEPTSHTYKEWIVDLKNILEKEYNKRKANSK